MARLEYIRHEFADPSLSGQGELIWTKQAKRSIEALPQIFWEDARAWDEVNSWASDRAMSGVIDLETIKRTMKHLRRYANYLEEKTIDWRHFPVRKDEQVLRRFRQYLMQEAATGMLAGSTASRCMDAVIQFYRFADLHNLVGVRTPMWADRTVVIPYFDATGFKRSMVRFVSELRIPDRKLVGARLEGGLLPLRAQHMGELLAYTATHEIEELHLMLGVGFFTGARVGTVRTLTVTSLALAREDPLVPGIYLLRAGPGTGIATKFSVVGELMVPQALLADLKSYATSTGRLLREAKAHKSHKNLLFLTRQGRPYTVETVNRLVHAMRRRAVSKGLQFMLHFRFHQSRATFGTWLMTLLLNSGSKTNAITVVRDAMFHKDERTTLGYITFLENTHAKGQAAAEFNEAFTGLRNRNWDELDA